MKRALLVVTLAAVICSRAVFAAEPILIGIGRTDISRPAIANLQELVHKIAGENAEIWMLHCDKYLSGPQTGHVFRVYAYLTPRLRTDRLIRGRSIFCIDQTMTNSSYPDSPTVGGWSTTDREQQEYALVATPNGKFTSSGPWTQPFTVSGSISDQDVVAVADIVHTLVPDQELRSLLGQDETHVQAAIYKHPGKYLKIDFEKAPSGWHGIKETTLVD
jgi:hypothetical protein